MALKQSHTINVQRLLCRERRTPEVEKKQEERETKGCDTTHKVGVTFVLKQRGTKPLKRIPFLKHQG